MLFSRKHIDKAGVDLIGTDPFKRVTALKDINDWRETHFFVLQKLVDDLQICLSENKIKYELLSSRIKRQTSIEAKLRNNPDMRLGGMQDIGGARLVFDNIDRLDEAIIVLNNFMPKGFKRERTYDYVTHPKETGYRSFHYVYKYISEDEKYDKISVELQVRTRLQHAWAMAVETASLISQTTLKADIKDKSEWRGFFKLVSALCAVEEGKPVHDKYADYDNEKFCTEYFEYQKKKLVDQLKALRVTVNMDFKETKGGYCVLTIDFNQKIVNAQTFAPDQEENATKLFNSIERSLTIDEAALIVAIENMQEIKDAYPSYFLDTQKFLVFLEQFEQRCKLRIKKC